MLDKQIIPAEEEIRNLIGEKSIENIEFLINCLNNVFRIKMELKFPFGNKVLSRIFRKIYLQSFE